MGAEEGCSDCSYVTAVAALNERVTCGVCVVLLVLRMRSSRCCVLCAVWCALLHCSVLLRRLESAFAAAVTVTAGSAHPLLLSVSATSSVLCDTVAAAAVADWLSTAISHTAAVAAVAAVAEAIYELHQRQHQSTHTSIRVLQQ